MKRISVLLLLVVFSVGLVSGEVVEIPDPTLRKHFEKTLNKKEGDAITTEELETIGALMMDENSAIVDLTGVEHCTDLWRILINGGKTRDLTPISNLINLKSIDIRDNRITDVSPLSKLRKLEYLNLDGNRIREITALANLPNLRTLQLYGNKLTDESLAPIANIISLMTLRLGRNNEKEFGTGSISDLNPISKLTLLQDVDLSMENIVDISPLKNNKNLLKLNVSSNKIRDISSPRFGL